MTLTKEKLLQKVAYYDKHDKHGKVFMPNSIFEILNSSEELMRKKAPHIAIAYTYLYLMTWLYRNAKYGQMMEEDLTVGAIKEMITLSAINKDFNYVIKKGGVLDTLGLTRQEKLKDAPIFYTFEGEVLEFTTSDDAEGMKTEQHIQDEKDMGIRRNNKNATYKYPVFACEDADGEYGQGTLWNIENTHQIPFEVFIECMTNEKLGCVAFYLYAYLHSRCQMNGGSIEVSVDKISEVTGIKHTTRTKFLDALKTFGLVKVIVPADYIIGKGDLETPANVYKTITDERSFYKQPQLYPKGKVMTLDRYKENEANKAVWDNKGTFEEMFTT